MTKHLWESEHSYYAQSGNYFSNDCHKEYDSWAAFVATEGDSDLDLNMLYRWDWRVETHDDGKPTGEHYLELYFMGQRKALARSAYVKVIPGDEQAIKAWLAIRWDYLRTLWAPVSS